MLIQGDGEGNLPCTSTQPRTQSLVKSHMSHDSWSSFSNRRPWGIWSMLCEAQFILIYWSWQYFMSLDYFLNLLLLLKVKSKQANTCHGSCHCHQEKHVPTILLTAQAELQPNITPKQMLTFRDISKTMVSKVTFSMLLIYSDSSLSQASTPLQFRNPFL